VKRWNDNDTTLFMQLVRECRDKLNNKSYVKKEIFKGISELLEKKRIKCSRLQYENKLKTLINKYKEIVDYNSRTGNERKEWIYFDLLEDYMGHRANVKSRAKCSSLLYSDIAQSSSQSGSSSITESEVLGRYAIN
jgi:hypothetical protein